MLFESSQPVVTRLFKLSKLILVAPATNAKPLLSFPVLNRSEAAVWWFSVKKVFVKISQNSQEKHLCQNLFFNKIGRPWGLPLYLKRYSGTGVFLWILQYLRLQVHSSCRTERLKTKMRSTKHNNRLMYQEGIEKLIF